MELLLNLFWLTLVMPVLWMGRRRSACAIDCRHFDGIRTFLLLSCLLILLFPVVSATDDLHAMRGEMEECVPSKRMIRQAAGEKSFAGLTLSGVLPASIFPLAYGPSYESCGQIILPSIILPQPAYFNQRATRAPPFLPLGEAAALAA